MLSAILFFTIFNFGLNLTAIGLYVISYIIEQRKERFDEEVEDNTDVDYEDKEEDMSGID
jgi:hypothetical protein